MVVKHSVHVSPNNPAFGVSANAWNAAHVIDNATITDAQLVNPKAYLVVYANGATDGTQINASYATNPYIELAAGNFVIDADITPPVASVMRIAPGVSFTWGGFKINIINSGVTIKRDTIQSSGTGVADVTITQLNIDSTNGSVQQIFLSGLTITTYNQIVVSAMGAIVNENCKINTLVQTNTTGNQYPTENNFVTCSFGNAIASSTVITLGNTFGQIWFHDCLFLFNGNSQTMIGCNLGALSTAIFISNGQVVTSTSSITSPTFFSLVRTSSAPTVGCTFNFSNFYVEQTNNSSSLTLFQLDTHLASTSEIWGNMMNFNFIDPGPITITSINSSQTLANTSKITFMNFSSHGNILTAGAIPGGFTATNVLFWNCQGISSSTIP